jgi:predicted dehydrogenase
MVQFAIIGCGKVASIHAAIIKNVGSLVAVCDINKKKAKSLAGQHNAQSYYSVEELLEAEKEIDVVVICSPNGLHAEHCIKSLQAGKHVLCEEPFCLTGAAAWQIIETAKFSRKKLMLVNEVAADTSLVALKKETISQFQLSCFKQWLTNAEDWRNQTFPGGNALLVHFHQVIETLVWLLGDIEIAETIISENNAQYAFNGITALQMKNGVLGTINWCVGADEKDEVSLKLISKNNIIIDGNDIEDFYLSYEESYRSLLAEIGQQSSFATNTDKVKVIEAIERIYKSVSPQIIEQA